MHPPTLPDGLAARPLGLPDDAGAAIGLVRAYEAACFTRPTQPAEELLAQIGRIPDLAEHALLVEAAPGSPVALVVLVPDDNPRPPRTHWVELCVHPDLDPGARESLARALVGAGLEHARRFDGAAGPAGTAGRDGSAGAGPAEVMVGIPRDDAAAATALVAAGFAVDRTFWEMVITYGDVDGAVGVGTGPAPDGVTVRRLRDRESDWRLAHALTEDAFADHWGHRERSFELWWTHQTAAVPPEAALSWVADLDGEPVAVCLTDGSRAATGGGYVRTLGVLARARGRGVARYLLRTAFAAHAARGWTWTALRVDSTNPTGATALYTSVGMAAVDVFDVYAHSPGAAGAPAG